MSTQTGRDKQNQYRSELTANLISMIETNTAPWQKPWTPTGSPAVPHNPTGKKTYRGSNVYWLICEMLRNGWDDPRFMTYKQAELAGYQVAKGSKSTTVEFWQQLTKVDTMTDSDTGNELVSIRPRMIHKTYRVFNAAQIEGIPAIEPSEPVTIDWEPFAIAETILAESKATIAHNGYDRAFYVPTFDTITLPDQTAFETAGDYYGTALHELSHWTGHETRLKRDQTGHKMSHNYAIEELIAESSTYLLCLTLGIPFNPIQSAAYCQGWAKPLLSNPHAIPQAFSAGNKAADYLAQFAHETEGEVAA